MVFGVFDMKIGNGIYTFDDLFTSTEITQFLNLINNSSNEKPFFLNAEFKNSKLICPDISHLIGQRVLSHFENEHKYDYNESFNTCNIIYYSKIKIGQPFSIHTDTGSYFNKSTNTCSRFTILLYLNDDFNGGFTQFYNNDLKKTHCIIPKKNKTLLFDINLFHSANPVESGTKYWIGTELIGLIKPLT